MPRSFGEEREGKGGRAGGRQIGENRLSTHSPLNVWGYVMLTSKGVDGDEDMSDVGLATSGRTRCIQEDAISSDPSHDRKECGG
jgi:hypothetical protein